MAKKRSLHISVLGSRLTSVVSVTLVLVILGVAAVMTMAARSATDNVRRNMGFTVKMERGISDAATNAMKKTLAAAPFAESFVYASADDILAQECEIIGEDIMLLVDENPYGAEFDVRVRPDWASGDSILALSARIGAMEGVDEVETDTSVIDSVNTNIARLTWIMLAVAAALLVISFVLINNTVSLAVYSRRFVIHTMRLVGATGAFIRRPFLAAGALTGLTAAILASGILAGAQAYAMHADAALAANLSWTTSAAIYAALIIAGVLICLLASLFATNRYLRSDIDDYYMN
ncbi:MAG: permease-like cell division protein FtsX [Muribaculaceae bacterium]|nr:permease-like cell division protein FtsX [Muribaculaceae bacterium]MDE6486609.1 permease-like cell division protein FtsX [Muribaculaceae bacterium]